MYVCDEGEGTISDVHTLWDVSSLFGGIEMRSRRLKDNVYCGIIISPSGDITGLPKREEMSISKVQLLPRPVEVSGYETDRENLRRLQQHRDTGIPPTEEDANHAASRKHLQTLKVA